MVRFPVTPGKAENLRRRMADLNLQESDFIERFYCPTHGRKRKRGGQVAVHLRHESTGLEVRCQKSTSQPLNRFHARRQLVELLEKWLSGGDDTAAKKKENVAAVQRGGEERPEHHMQRMFGRSFEKDIAQPYPVSAQKLLMAGDPEMKRIGIMGEREDLLRGKREPRPGGPGGGAKA